METQHRTLTIEKPDAEQLNRDLMQAFHEALAKNPAVDLLSVVGETYLGAHRVAQYSHLSEAGQYNLQTVHDLHDEVIDRPEVDLRAQFPADYARRYRWAMPKPEEKPPPQPKPHRDWVSRKLDAINTASIIYPLSDHAWALLRQYPEASDVSEETSLAASLKSLILQSERLFELSIRTGVVVRCSDSLVLKVFPDTRDLTEYHNLQYLAHHAYDLPIPKPHGLVMLGGLRAMFLSYVPGTTLDKVWPGLSHEAKLSVQKQLDRVFSRLRGLRQDDGQDLGGVRGEGVKDYRIMEVFSYKGINTAKGFDELQFSAKHCASPCYVRLLRSFLEKENESLRGSVFTHGDLKKCNIMVNQDPVDGNTCLVTGIIDWEDGGFYPEYYECTTLSNGQSIMSDDDWYLYAPDCISPLRFPVRWLVDRLWGNLLWSWRTDIVR
ncbi:kinase-like protein [Aspergillus aurantiobrunneus]